MRSPASRQSWNLGLLCVHHDMSTIRTSSRVCTICEENKDMHVPISSPYSYSTDYAPTFPLACSV